MVINSYLPQKNRFGPYFVCEYWIILRDASLEPIFKGHSSLFILASSLLPKSTVHGTKFSLSKKKAINLDLSGMYAYMILNLVAEG